MKRPVRHQLRLEAESRLPLRKLLHRDLNSGMQQKDMAELYRVSRSIVSYWIIKENIHRKVTWE